MSELVPFRFEITDDRLVATDYQAMRRAQEVVDHDLTTVGAYLTTTPDPLRFVTIAEGEAPQRVVTILQAIAMGHDLAPVLDLLAE